ncbi:GILT-like protein 1 [Arctopsyche grandis]|uniref:GILT-like protein 1 n=1 Tax=Arctopsyche grandis TaxID=121162 RepID=UPI00406D73B5
MKQIISMKHVIGLLCLIALVSAKSKKTDSNDKIKVAVYYEALCPDSVRFITKQLYPAWQTMHNAFKVKLIPYGKAVHNKIDGKWQFECQHGPKECYGNKIQGCTLKIKSLSDENKFDLINCLMSNKRPDAALSECSTKLNITTTDVQTCADGTKGDDILATYGDKTANLKPSLSFVPTVIFNEKFDQDQQNEAMVDLKSVICKLATKKPAQCA